MNQGVTPPIASEPHNHNDCVRSAMEAAKKACAQSGTRLTPTRERVLYLIWQSHNPLGAYDIIAQLSKERADEQRSLVAPPTVYRALDFLLEQGLIHRIASQNAFVGCNVPMKDHISQFLICNDCGVAIELHAQSINQAVRENARSCDFQIESETIEVHGRCARCRRDVGND